MTKEEIVNDITTILRDLESMCSETNFEDEFIQLVDYHDFNFSSDRLDQYYDKITLFVDLASKIKVGELIENGFVCSKFQCKDRYLLGLKTIFPRMIHILQDILLCRNTLQIPQYIIMFSRISRRDVAEMELKKLRKANKELRATHKQISNELSRGGLRQHEMEDNNLKRVITNKNIEIWVSEKRENGIQAGEIRKSLMMMSNDDIQDMIIIPDKDPERSNVRKMLFQVIYLRTVDNFCRNLDGSTDGGSHDAFIDSLIENLEFNEKLHEERMNWQAS